MTKEELEKEATECAEYEKCAHCSNPERCPGKEDCYDLANVKQYYLAGVEPMEKYIIELEKENGKLEGKLADLQSEYIELENFKNNEVKGLKDTLDRVESENVRLIGKLAFTENTLNNCIAQIEELEKENARLKEKCNSLQELVTYYQTNFCQEQSSSLKDAESNSKFIIDKVKYLKQLLQDIIITSGFDREELLKEAEQFLKEVDSFF